MEVEIRREASRHSSESSTLNCGNHRDDSSNWSANAITHSARWRTAHRTSSNQPKRVPRTHRVTLPSLTRSRSDCRLLRRESGVEHRRIRAGGPRVAIRIAWRLDSGMGRNRPWRSAATNTLRNTVPFATRPQLLFLTSQNWRCLEPTLSHRRSSRPPAAKLMTTHAEIVSRLQSMGLRLPPVPRPVAAYTPFVRSGDLLFVSGQIPSVDGRVTCTGRVPSAAPIDRAIAAARQCALNGLAVVAEAAGGDLGRVRRIVRVGVFVQCDDGFAEQPKVANGASELLRDLFGDRGVHARAAVGVNALPLDASVEVEMMVEVMSS